MSAACRAGATRPEVLTLLALGVLLAGLAVPAVAKVRAASNREQCRNNLKQIGAATLKFADAHNGALPPTLQLGAGPAGSFLPQILPYSEHSKLADKLAASGKPWHDPVNAGVVATHLAFAQCPDAPKPDRLLEGKVGEDAFKAAPTDYTAVPLITEAIRDIFPEDHDRSTALGGLAGPGTLGQITDGLSNSSIGLLEIADKPNRWQNGKLLAARGVGGMGTEGTWVANGINATRGYSWDGKTFPGPCAMNCTNGAAVYSFHEGGCNFLFADGSVRFLKKDIDVWIYYAVLTRRGGELLADGDF